MIMSMKNSNDTNDNGTRDLPVCRAVHQPNAPRRNVKVLRVPHIAMQTQNVIYILSV
jgi:hypothetical protein